MHQIISRCLLLISEKQNKTKHAESGGGSFKLKKQLVSRPWNRHVFDLSTDQQITILAKKEVT